MKLKSYLALFWIAFLFGCRKPASEQDTNKTDSTKLKTTRPLQKAATEVAPITIAPQIGKDGRVAAMGQQWFFYDANTRKAATPDGPEVKSNSIIPMRILSGGGVAFTGCYVYKNVLLDLTNLQKIDYYPFAIVKVNDDQQLISVAIQGHKNILIDDTYTVFADDSRTVSPDGPFVTVRLHSEGTNDEPIAALRGILQRAGEKEQAFETGKDGNAYVLLENAEETAVTILVTDANGEKPSVPTSLRQFSTLN